MMRLLVDAKDIEEATVVHPRQRHRAERRRHRRDHARRAAGRHRHDQRPGPDRDLYALKNALGPRFRSRAQWMANSAIYDLCRGFGTSIANIWAESLQEGTPSKFIGYPVNENSLMDSATTTTKKIALLRRLQAVPDRGPGRHEHGADPAAVPAGDRRQRRGPADRPARLLRLVEEQRGHRQRQRVPPAEGALMAEILMAAESAAVTLDDGIPHMIEAGRHHGARRPPDRDRLPERCGSR
jgi:hypothetical protein